VEQAREKAATQIEELKASGMQLYEPTEEELAAFKESVQPLYDKYKDIWGAELLEAFQKR